MVIENDIPGVGPQPLGPAGPAGASASKLPEVRGADFARILEELMVAAGNLGAQASESRIPDPQSLQSVVAEAKQSLDSAISLGESLLDAYRRASLADRKPSP